MAFCKYNENNDYLQPYVILSKTLQTIKRVETIQVGGGGHCIDVTGLHTCVLRRKK